ncbi:TonB-dependent receptor [Pseudoalteromonas piratica]|uniref:TonB-dependent receptor n=1 Tax=Pseudoalteromonas piratica TaxID=1348114 RepID=A0A0A7EEU8_9GAMM|nr:TonB-dependent receptor [Pseudoalteromonas piratica]AIY65109.1 TonB-dependent receptor [Pseudoalteromonas piratica]
MKYLQKSKLANLIQGSLFSSLVVSGAAFAQGEEAGAASSQLEVIQVTARKRVENAQEIPVAVSALQGDNLDAYSSAGMDIRFMNAKIPSLSVESSFGRTFPRFYVRGLGNTDFDLNASQPVSLVVDDVVQENPILKGFPVFDIERIEVLRGPQGTLFGRNTPAGLVKFDSVKPSQEFDAYTSLSYGTRGAMDFEGAVGTGLTDNISMRVSTLWQEKDNYIDTVAPGAEQKDVLGGYSEKAARVQFLYEGNDFTGLLNFRYRDLDGEPIVFYGNLMDVGSNKIRAGWKDDVVHHDAAKNATQQVETQGVSLKLEWDLNDHTITSISAWDSAEIFSRADVDGGYGCGFCGMETGHGFIPFAAESADAIPDHDQITQELRLSSNFSGDLNYQVGVFYFDEDLTIESFSYDTLANGAQNGYAVQNQQTKAWALFGSVDYTLSDALKVTAGLRYSDDEKDFVAERIQGPFGSGTAFGEANPSDDHVSWDLSATYKLTDDVNLFARAANSFRAPSIQGRILFGDEVTVADSETINSIEAGVKSDILDGRGRLNMTVFYYQMDDQQLTAVGGDSNFNRLLNADKTTGYGFEMDSEWVLADDLFATFNLSYNNTELKDDSLYLPGCFGCTITDPMVEGKGYSIDGNSLPHAPEWIANFTLRYSKEIGDGEFFAYTDWSYRSEIDFFLYRSVEFTGEALFEGGLRTGYNWASGDNEYEVAAFARNLTDERVVIGGVDFNNNTGIVNEGRFVGVEFKAKFF